MATARASQARVMLGVTSSRVLGLAREMLLAFVGGAGVATDVLQVVFRGPNLVQNLLGEQALSASFIPVYSRLLGDGREEEARRFAGASFGILAVAAAALAVGGVALARVLVLALAPGFAGDAVRFETAVSAVRLLFPMTAVLVLSAWCLSILNSHRRFFLPYFAPVAWNACIVAALAWLAVRADVAPGVRELVLTVSAAALAGGVLQFLIQVPSALRLVRGLDPRPSLDAPGVRQALSAFGPALLGRGVVQLSGWLDVFLGSWLATGAVAALGFAQRLYALPLVLFGTSFAVVELPELSRLRDDSETAKRRLAASFAGAAFLTVPSAVGLVVFGLPIVRAVYERGRFGLDASLLVYLVLAAYAIGLLPSVAARLVQSASFAAGDTRAPAAIALARVLLAAAVGGSLMLWLDGFRVASWARAVGVAGATVEGEARAGALGLAVGSALAAWFELWILRRVVARRFVAIELPWRRVALFAALAAAACGPTAIAWWLARETPPPLQAAVVVTTFAGVYFGGSHVTGLAEMRALLRRAAGPRPGRH